MVGGANIRTMAAGAVTHRIWVAIFFSRFQRKSKTGHRRRGPFDFKLYEDKILFITDLWRLECVKLVCVFAYPLEDKSFFVPHTYEESGSIRNSGKRYYYLNFDSLTCLCVENRPKKLRIQIFWYSFFLLIV